MGFSLEYIILVVYLGFLFEITVEILSLWKVE